MKLGIYILIAALLLGMTGFFVMRGQCGCVSMKRTVSHHGSSQLPELDWLHRELQLSDEQFAKISALHLAYRPTCEALCMKVMASHEKVKQLVHAGQQMTPELRIALQEHAALHVECQTAMLTHLFETSACMPPAQAQHYLNAMLPQVIEMAMEPASMSDGH